MEGVNGRFSTLAFNETEIKVAAEVRDSSESSGRLGIEGVCDHTGHSAWSAMPLLVTHLLRADVQQRLQETPDMSVVELGAGLGVPGLLCARNVANVTLTDNNPRVLRRLERSVLLNAATFRCPEKISVRSLEWGEAHVPQELAGTVSLILASDCVYDTLACHRLFETAAALLTCDGMMLMAYVSRWQEVDNALASVASCAGFHLEDVTEKSSQARQTEPWSAVLLIRRNSELSDLGQQDLHVEDDTGLLVLNPAAVCDASLSNLRGCNVQHIVTPRGVFRLTPDQLDMLAVSISQWSESLTTLDLSGEALEEGTHLPKALHDGKLNTLAVLCFARSNLGPKNAVPLASALAQLPALRELDLSLCMLGREGATALGHVPGSFRHIRVLLLADNQIGDEGAQGMLPALEQATSLTALNLDNNRITHGSVGPVMMAMPPSLKKMIIANNPLEAYGAHLMSAALPHLLALEHLDVRGCSLGDGGAATLAPVWKELPSLSVVLLASNSIGNSGADSVAEELDECNITELSLAMGCISEEGAETLAACVPDSCIRTLDISGNALGNAGAEHFASSLADMTSLKTLDMHDNSIGDAGALAFAETLRESPSLEVLDLSEGSIGPSSAAALVHAAQHCAKLQELRLQGNGYFGAAATETMQTSVAHITRDVGPFVLRLPMAQDAITWGT